MTLVCCLGDVLLDVVVVTGAPNVPGADTPAATLAGAGGQAANVAAWVVSLGGQARLVAAQAGDLAGQLVAADLRRRGVDLSGPVLDGTTGVVVSISEPDGERHMLTDRGVCPRLTAAQTEPGWFTGCDWLHLPFYSLVDAPIREAALAAARQARRVSVDLSSVSVLRDIGPATVRRLLGLLHPQLILANQAEADLAGLRPGEQATVVVKLGAGGVQVNGRGYPARLARPADSTGAGDAFAAGFLLGGVDLGLDAAARAVSRLGAMPPPGDEPAGALPGEPPPGDEPAGPSARPTTGAVP